MATTHDLSAVLADAPRNSWLALDENGSHIVGRGGTIQEALDEAVKAGVEDPLMMWSPEEWVARVLTAGCA